MLNERTREIYAFIERFTRDRGFPPTIREIGDAFEIHSTNGVRYHLNLLQKQGYLKRQEKISRGIEAIRRVPDARAEHRGIPILGRVAAGQPTLAEESYEGRLETDQMFGNPRELFALRVRGDSMIEAGIHENDYVVVRQQESASPGEMVVALLEGEATVKFYQPRGSHVTLVPANAKYEPIRVKASGDFRVLGVVKGVVRTLRR